MSKLTPDDRDDRASMDGSNYVSATQLDGTDHRIIAGLRSGRRSSVSDLSRRLGLARGTVQSRLDRMEREQIIEGYGPDLNLKSAGFPVRAFTTLAISQGRHDAVVSQLKAIPNVLEVHTTTGPGDMLIKIGAKSNDHLNDLLQSIARIDEVSHLTTQLALASPVLRSAADLLAATEPSPPR